MSGWLAIVSAIILVVIIPGILWYIINDLVNNSWGLGTRFGFQNWKIAEVFILQILGAVYVGVGVCKLVRYRSSRILNLVVFSSLFGVALIFIVLYADVFKMFGLIDTGNHQSEIHDPMIALYFSAITWTTVGYGDFVPTESARLFAATEAFIGHVWMGLLIAVIAWVLTSQIPQTIGLPLRAATSPSTNPGE